MSDQSNISAAGEKQADAQPSPGERARGQLKRAVKAVGKDMPPEQEFRFYIESAKVHADLALADAMRGRSGR